VPQSFKRHRRTADSSAIGALRRNWRVYLMESAGLAFFMIPAATMTLALFHPAALLHRLIPSSLGRHALLGLVLGLVVLFIVYNPWGRRSGAHVNPGITLVFLRLGRIEPWDACFYIVAQFLGGIAAAFAMRLILGDAFAHPDVMYATTRPGPAGTMAAFAAELIISFILMFAILVAVHTRRLEPYTGVIVSALIAIYLTIETPLSGMSLNPARSFGSALAGNVWTGLWLYFVAPPIGMLLACEVWLRVRTWLRRRCSRKAEPGWLHFLCEEHEPPTYPVPMEGE
jgi:aquaporin Z